MRDFRILVTGSRDWPKSKFEQIDDDICDTFGYTKWWEVYDRITVIHGECPYGGADLAASIAIKRIKNSDDGANSDFFFEESYSADFKTLGAKAGPIRNKLMVSKGADICLAYPIGESKGTRGCIKLAKAAGIPVKITEG